MKNKKTISIIVGIIIIGIAFFGGMQYGKSTVTPGSFSATDFQNMRTFDGQGRIESFSGASTQESNLTRGGFTTGEILSKDDSSITIKLPDGGSRIVFISTSTQISKMASSSVGDLAVRDSVSVTGSINSDGSITAQSVQIRN